MTEKIKVEHVAFSDIDGGAARAAYRVHQALINNELNELLISRMRVIRKLSDDPSVTGGPANDNYVRFFAQRVLNKFSRKIYSIRNGNKNIYSTAWPSSGLGKELNFKFKKNQIDIVNLHWLGDYTLSIKEIGKLEMPLTWRLPDQWAFCGCEHYTEFSNESLKRNFKFKYQRGYGNSFSNFWSLNINDYSWNLKMKNWHKPINIIAPSNWIAECAKKSKIFKDSFISVIPTPIDLEKWKPINKKNARQKLFLSNEKKLILFGAIGGLSDKRKGGDLLIEILKKIKDENINDLSSDYEVVVLGEKNEEINIPGNIKTHLVGKINNDKTLALYYSACDIFVLPSRQDNLPGTGLEALACGLPVAAFDIGGLSDIVDHRINGVLAPPFDCNFLASEINWMFNDKERLRELSLNCRLKAQRLWSQKRVSDLYYDHYLTIIDKAKKGVKI